MFEAVPWRGRETHYILRYYDYHDRTQLFTVWDPGLVDWASVGLDSANIILSFVALNAPVQSLKAKRLRGLASAINVATLLDMVEDGGWREGEWTEIAISGASFLPGYYGAAAGVVAVVFDLRQGI